MIKVFSVILGIVVLAGCSSLPGIGGRDGVDGADGPLYVPPVAIEEGCAALQYQTLIGQLASEVHVDSLPQPHRVYGRGDPVTMDYRPDRLNLVVNADGRIGEVKCG